VLPTLSRLGTLLGSEDQRQDVTGDVVDAARRLASEEASVARVRALLSRARTIGEVVSVESELTKREASLESLKGRLAALKGQVSYATITMNLSTPAAAPKPPKPTPAGFLAGLRSGWHTFAAVLRAAHPGRRRPAVRRNVARAGGARVGGAPPDRTTAGGRACGLEAGGLLTGLKDSSTVRHNAPATTEARHPGLG
jgi:Domain of unknown function (DUF4349)